MYNTRTIYSYYGRIMVKNQYPRFWVILIVGLALAGLFWLPTTTNSAPTPSVSIAKGKSTTNTRQVTLYLTGPEGVRKMKVSNNASLSEADWQTYAKTLVWTLKPGSGLKTVYVKFKDSEHKETAVFSDTITLSIPSEMTIDFQINNNSEATEERNVQLSFTWSAGVEQFKISNSSDFAVAEWQPVTASMAWVLSEGSGNKTVYVRFLDGNEKTKTINKTIKYTQSANYISSGTLLKGQNSAIYYLGFDGKLHPFFNAMIYLSWYKDFANLKHVSNAKLSEYLVGEPVCVRPGTWLLKFKNASRVYAVEPGCRLRALRSEAEAHVLYGPNWQKRILEVDSVLAAYYEIIEATATSGTDKDKDGVDEETEAEYGTSDNKADSDNDKLNDYEEIYYWFSDPADADSDNDGFGDGLEIINGYAPLGNAKLTTIPSGTYQYPLGTLVKDYNKVEHYYRRANGSFYALGKDTGAQKFSSNRLQDRFLLIPAYNLSVGSAGKLGDSLDEIRYPQRRTKTGSLINL